MEHRFYDWDPIRHIAEDKVCFSLMIESSRGCPFKCVFCTTNKIKGKTWRGKSVDRIFAEYDHFNNFLKKRVNPEGLQGKILFHFPDDNFCFDNSRVVQFCERLLKIPEDSRPLWDAMGKADKVRDRDLLDLMKKAGCLRVFMGAESGYEMGLKKIKKGITLEMIEDAVNTVLSTDFPLLVVSWIFGFPWEKRSDALRTILKGVNLTLKDPEKIKLAIYAFTPIVGAEITKQIDTYLVGRSSDVGRFDSWGFDHPFMNNDDLLELQLVSGWFIMLLDIKNHIPEDPDDYKKTVFEKLDYAESAEMQVKRKMVKLFFKKIRKLFFNNINSKPEILFKSVNRELAGMVKTIEDELKSSN